MKPGLNEGNVLSTDELNILERYVATYYRLTDLEIHRSVLPTGEIRFGGTYKVTNNHKAQVSITVDTETARHWIDRIQWIDLLSA
jgi:hypothetical protein